MLPLSPPFPPMEAGSADEIPKGPEWQYEPKWDGFRCLVFKDGANVHLQSKAGKPLGRYFPELVDAVRALPAPRFVLDGEIVIREGDSLSFDQLLLRLHPAESRVRKLSAAHPAELLVFDLLVDPRGTLLTESSLEQRRKKLTAFARRVLKGQTQIHLSPFTDSLDEARRWTKAAGPALDGIIAKQTDLPYRSGERDGMLKIKTMKTADCVVGGWRGERSGRVGSLLLGLYNRDNLLDHVGFLTVPPKLQHGLQKKLSAAAGKIGFTGRAPGGESRWAPGRSTKWTPLEPTLVVEVSYDHFTGGRFRHGTKFLRWRPDKKPEQCKIQQVEIESTGALFLLDDLEQ